MCNPFISDSILSINTPKPAHRSVMPRHWIISIQFWSVGSFAKCKGSKLITENFRFLSNYVSYAINICRAYSLYQTERLAIENIHTKDKIMMKIRNVYQIRLEHKNVDDAYSPAGARPKASQTKLLIGRFPAQVQ